MHHIICIKVSRKEIFLKPKKLLVCFLLFFILHSLIAQSIKVEIMSEEIIKWHDKTFNILHLYTNPFNKEYTDKAYIKEICNYLQRERNISEVDLNALIVLNYQEFDKELNIIWMGGHPIFEWWNNSCEWHMLKYGNYIYIIKGIGYQGSIYKLKILD